MTPRTIPYEYPDVTHYKHVLISVGVFLPIFNN